MSKKADIQPWKKTCVLRPEIRERKLTASDFAIDLHKVINGGPGKMPFYCDPEQFFATTYATQNLRQFCKVVLRRLAEESGGESIINVAQTFGGGKSHTLTALYYLTSLGPDLPKIQTSVGMILNDSNLKDPPSARIAAVSFDKVDWKAGGDAKSPSGELRRFRMPWNLIAWQLLGQRGLDILQRDETKSDFDTPPADTLWAAILEEVEASGQGAMILIDEFLMWAHDAASPDPTGKRPDRGPVWYDRLKNFFQKLAQAVESSLRSCLVVSLLATEPNKVDDVGKAILSACNNGLNRQASLQSPVEKDDLAELLRRRLFKEYPENATERHKHILAFWHRLQAVDPIHAKLPDSQERLKKAYPFHPDLLDRFFGKWIDLNQFQRTRGVLQTFAMALRDAEPWDDSPLVSAQAFLVAPGKDGLSEALQKLSENAKDSDPDRNPQWPGNLKTELPRALAAQRADAPTLTGREIEASCVATFIYSQPIGEQAELTDIRWLLGATCDMPAVFNNGLNSWARTSWYLEECETTEAATDVPKYWRLGPKPNLNQLHDSYKRQALKHARSKFDDLARTKCPPLYEGCLEDGVKPHKLPKSPADVGDDGQFRLVVLGAEYAGIVGDPPKPEASEFIRRSQEPIKISCLL
ncbi:MAG: ATP-binding protein [Deltaproteobacteria bacterium]|nr:ATP-binding protein [Deltaproteobacteria bacterium]